ncbi:hypothetical protein [Nocardia sp. NPDC051981]|uniref:hypothetical protein n=1 Tax=Nocardia sp. NPDC051981 TaxID=3155417 RepID=UPI00341ADEF6
MRSPDWTRRGRQQEQDLRFPFGQVGGGSREPFAHAGQAMAAAPGSKPLPPSGLTALSLTFLLPAPIVRVGRVFVGVGMIWLATWLRAAAGRAADRLPQ